MQDPKQGSKFESKLETTSRPKSRIKKHTQFYIIVKTKSYEGVNKNVKDL